MPGRRRSPVSRLLGHLSDDTKGFLDDLTVRAQEVEAHARDALRHAAGDDARDADADRREVEELSAALAELTKKVNGLADGGAVPGGASSPSRKAGR